MAWAKAPIEVMTNTALSPWARLLVVMLRHHHSDEHGIFPGRDLLAAELGCSTDTIDRSITELVAAGLVVKRRQGRGHTNRYELVDDSAPGRSQVADESAPVRSQAHESAPVRLVESAPMRSPESAPVRTPIRTRTKEQEPKEQENETPVVPRGRRPDTGEESMAFAAFWQQYPRHEKRADALRAWRKVALSPEIVNDIMAGLARLMPDYERRERQYIPQPTSWLNGERWNDDPMPAQQARAPAGTTSNGRPDFYARAEALRAAERSQS